MKKKSDMTNSHEQPGAAPHPAGMNRREMVRRLATAMTAAPALTVMGAAPVLAKGKPSAGAASGQPEEPDQTVGTGAAGILDPHQFETFTVIAERIIPGSTDAKVAQFVDLLLSVEAQPMVKRFVDALSAFEAYSLSTYQKPFIGLPEDQQNQVLTVASTAKPGGGLLSMGYRRVLGPQNAETGQNEKLTLRDHFEILKRATAEAYFSSEPGMKYLGWTGQVMWSSFPGCPHSDEHA